MTIQKLAEEWLEWFVWDKDREIYYLKEDAPSELLEVVRMAHGDMLPDNYKYEFIVEALEAIADYCGDEEDIEDLVLDFEPDAYTSELLDWLGSNLERQYYVDEAVSQLGHGEGIMEDIAMGQVEEKREVFYTVLNCLRDKEDEV